MRQIGGGGVVIGHRFHLSGLLFDSCAASLTGGGITIFAETSNAPPLTEYDGALSNLYACGLFAWVLWYCGLVAGLGGRCGFLFFFLSPCVVLEICCLGHLVAF